MTDTGFSKLAEDVVLNIFFKLEDDPRNWARLACVCTKFSSLIRTVCWKIKCSQTIPSVVSDLLSDSATAPLGGWASLHKLAVCCPASSTPESCWRIRILGSSERSDPMRITTKTGYFNWVSPEQRLLRAQLKVIQRRLFLGLSVLGLYLQITLVSFGFWGLEFESRTGQ
ncbi:hypothetical protein CsSME_00047319 [Camellia sinensis var. sinensis]